MKPHPRVAWQVIDGQAVLMDLDKGLALGLNRTGSFLWPRLEGRSEEDLVADLSAAYAVEPDWARGDVRSFLDLLRRRGLLEG